MSKVPQLHVGFYQRSIDPRALHGFRVFLQKRLEVLYQCGAFVSGIIDGLLQLQLFGWFRWLVLF
jgi:hypothetical protein